MYYVRKAVVDDIAVIQEIAAKVWPDAYGNILSENQLSYMLDKMYNAGELERQINNGVNFFLLVQDNDNTVSGFAACQPGEENEYWLNKLYILPGQQGTGAGGVLLAKVEATARENNVSELKLQVNRYNPARHFYEKKGFKVLYEKDFDIGNGYYMNDYVMQKML